MEQTKQATILVVDDDEFNLKLLKKMLSVEGHAVRTAASGAEALASVVEQLPDLILLDIMMPGMDGFEVARRLKADSRSRSTPIIMVTALEDQESRLKGLEAGAEEFLSKPVDRAELQIRVKNLLKVKEYQDFLANHNRILEEQVEVRTAALQESEEKFRKITESAQDAIIMMGSNQRISFWNAAAERLFGYTAAEAMGQELHPLITPASAHAAFARAFPHFQETGEGALIGKVTEVTALRKGGKEFTVELSISATQLNGQWHAISMVRDITGRKQAETAIQHANRALATLSAVNRSLVHAGSEEELLQSISQAIVQQRGYQLAWVGYVQHDENKSIKIMAYASIDGGYPDTMQPTWAESGHGLGPSGRAVRSGATQLCQDIANDPHYSPWRDEALKRGYMASIALPLLNGSHTVFGTLTVYSNEVNAFSPTEVALLEEMAEDLTFGVRSLHTRHERDLALVENQQQLVQLQDSLEDTVRAIATIIEMRDPYTAGHEQRVADLAAAIAVEMGLSEAQVHGIHLAGTIHDLGKIRVPAEILSKPGKITDIEFSLIKVHPQAGYDILKDITFPWPIAQMVLQHHERMDGSGYPQGLKGDAILLEARVLCVADVVEAIFSHRPYRPGLGIEVALDEITRARGIYYDPQVVDACLAVFREQHYSFKS